MAEHQGVVVEPAEIIGGEVCRSPSLVPDLLTTIEAVGAKTGVPTSVGEADVEIRESVEHTAEDETGDGNGGLERIANQIAQVVAGEK